MPLPATVGSGLSWSDHLSGRPGPFQGHEEPTSHVPSPDANSTSGNVAATARLAQTFTVPNNCTVDQVHLNVFRNGSTGRNYSVEIYATSGGLPTGAALSSGTLNTLQLGITGGTAITPIQISPVALTSGTTYAIVLRPTANDLDATNNMIWRGQAAGSYANGAALTYDSGTTTWTSTAADRIFRIYAQKDDIYVVAADKINNHVEVWKSTDSGQTWSEVDSANHKSISSTANFKSFDAVMAGATITVAYVTGASGADFAFCDFNTSTDAWGTPVSRAFPINLDGTGAAAIFVARRANGDTLVTRGGVFTSMGTDWRTVIIDRYVGGVWTGITLTPLTANNFDARPILTDGSIVVVPYVDVANDAVFVRALSSANSLGTAVTVRTVLLSTTTYIVGSGTYDGAEFNVPTWTAGTSTAFSNDRYTASGSTLTSAGTTAVSATTVTNPEPLTHAITLVNVDGTIHAFWINDNQTEIDRDNDAGTNTWGTDTAWKTGQYVNEASTANFPIYGGSGTNEAASQSFTADAAKPLTIGSISVWMNRNGTPTDNLTATIRTGSQTGTIVATSDALPASAVSSSLGAATFTFSSPPTLTGGTKYWVVIERSGARDTTNFCVTYYTTANPIANGAATAKNSGAWDAEGSNDVRMYIPGILRAIAAQPVSIGGSSVGILYLEGGTIKYDSYPQSTLSSPDADVTLTAADLDLDTTTLVAAASVDATVTATASDLALDSLPLVAGVGKTLNLTTSDLALGTTTHLSTGNIVAAVPISDINAGDWTTTPLWDKIDEEIASDSDFITSNNSTNTSAEVELGDLVDPQLSTSHIVRYRYSKDSAGGNDRDITVSLYQGITLIAEQTHTAISETWTDGSFTLTGTQADSITDYTDLRLRFTPGGTTGGPGGNRRSVQVSWAQLIVPLALTDQTITLTTSDLALGTTAATVTAESLVTMAVSDLALGATSLATQIGAEVSTSASDLSLNAIALTATGNVTPPPTVREVVETIETDLVADITVSLPTSAQAGDLMLVSVVTNGGTITAPPTGWDLVQYHSTQSNPRHALIRRIRQAGDSNTVVVTTSAVAATAIAAAIQDVDQTTPVDVVSAGTNTGSTGSDTMTAGGVTTTVDDTLLVYFGSINSSTQTFSPGTSGMTEVHEMSAGKRQVMLTEARPSAGATGDRVIVASSASLAWNAIMLALRPVAGPGVGDEVTITADGLSFNTTTVATQLGAGVLATAGDLALGTTTDTVTATSSVALTVSDLALNSTAPSMSQGAGITMTVSDLALGSTAIAISRGAGVGMTVGDLNLGTTTNTLTVSTTAALTVSDLALTGTTHAISTGSSIQSTAGDLAVGTTSPTISAASQATMAASDLSLNQTSPAISAGSSIQLTVSDLTLGTIAITVTRGAGVALSVSDLTLGATTISVAAASSETVTLAEGDLALGTTSLAIQIGAGAAITASDLSLGTTTATIGVGSTVPLTASDLSLGTMAITIQLGAGVAMTVGDVSLGSTTAAISVGASVSFAVSDLTLTTTTTAVSTGSSIATTAHGLTFDTTSTQISTGSSVAMTATGLALGTTEGSLTVSQLVSMTGGDLALGSAILAVSTGAGVGVTAGDLALNTQPVTVSGVQSATVSTTAADLALGQTSLSILLAASVLTTADNLNLGTTLANVQGSIVPQIVRPVSDVTVNDWTTAPLFEKIDEISASDADFIASNNNTNNFAEVALDDPIDPQVGDGHIVRYRYAKSAAAGNARNITVGLYQGTTLIAEQTHTGITEVWTAGSFTLTGTQADSITDYSDLRLRFTAGGTTGGSGGNRRSVQVSWAELQVPGAGTLSALVNMTKSDLALNTQPITLLMAAGVGLTAAGLALAGPTAVVGQSSSAVLATDTLQLGSQPHTISLGAGVALTSTGLALGSTSSALRGESSITLAATGLTLGTTSPLVQVGATVGLTAQDLLLGTTSADLIAEVVDGDQDVLLTAADLALGTQPHTIHAGALLVLTAAGLNLDARPASLGGSSLVTLARTTLALAGQSVATTGQLNATVFTVPGAFVVGSRPVAVSASSELQLTAAGLTLNGAPADLILLTDDSVVLLPATLILGTRPATLLIKIPEGAKTKICQICGIYQSWIRAYYMDANGNQLADYECERGDRWSQIIALQRILQLHYGRDWRRRLGRPR